MEENLSLESLAEGAAIEKFDLELQRAIEDLMDPNTDMKKPREVILKVRIHPGEGFLRRVEIFCDAKLGTNRQVETHFAVGRDAAGNIKANEYRAEQLPIFEQPAPGKVAQLDERRKP